MTQIFKNINLFFKLHNKRYLGLIKKKITSNRVLLKICKPLELFS